MKDFYTTSKQCHYFVCLACMILLLVSVNTLHAEQKCDGCGIGKFSEAVMTEGLILVMSKAASDSPNFTGGMLILFSPFAVADNASEAANMTMVVSTAAIGVYDVTISEKSYDDKRVLINNFIAFNAAGLLMMAVNHFTRNDVSSKSRVSIALLPKREELSLLISAPF